MNVEIGAEAALFPEKEYIKGIFVAVQGTGGRTSGYICIKGLKSPPRRIWEHKFSNVRQMFNCN